MKAPKTRSSTIISNPNHRVATPQTAMLSLYAKRLLPSSALIVTIIATTMLLTPTATATTTPLTQHQTNTPNENFTAVTTGSSHTCGLTDTGTIKCWGNNTYGQTKPQNGTNFTAITAGDYHTCGLTDTGTIKCWGYNNYGQTEPQDGTNFTAITAGSFHSCGLTDTGTIKRLAHTYGNRRR